MSKDVEVPFGDSPKETAILLLGAAEDQEQPSSVVRTTGFGAFVVPEEIAKAAGVEYQTDEADDTPSQPAKKAAAAKKTAAKKE